MQQPYRAVNIFYVQSIFAATCNQYFLRGIRFSELTLRFSNPRSPQVALNRGKSGCVRVCFLLSNFAFQTSERVFNFLLQQNFVSKRSPFPRCDWRCYDRVRYLHRSQSSCRSSHSRIACLYAHIVKLVQMAIHSPLSASVFLPWNLSHRSRHKHLLTSLARFGFSGFRYQVQPIQR